jgi:hypothetical protein
VISVLSPFREKRPRGNPLLRKGVQPPWLKPYNTGRKRGSRNRPKPKEPELIQLRVLEVTPEDEVLMAAPATPEETEELACHLRDIRRQRKRWLKYLRRYQPWRLLDQAFRSNPERLEMRQRDPSRIAADLLTNTSPEQSDLDD